MNAPDSLPEATPAIHQWLASGGLATREVIAMDGNAVVLDLSIGSTLYGEVLTGIGVERLGELINRSMADAGTEFAFGRYGEPRDLYYTENFAGSKERRDLHLGLDVFCVAGTTVSSPLDGMIEIVANKTSELDYGPMLILRHETGSGTPFFTLYGHLLQTSVAGRTAGDIVAAGEKIAEVGSPPENGNWPPHLHIQIITDLLDLGADFPGVAYRSQQSVWLELSPSPALFFPRYAPDLLDAVA